MKNNSVKKLVQASIFLALAIILQLIGRNFVQINPLLIGPLINTILLITTYICGLSFGIIISILIPILAVFTGALAAPLVPFVPFIAIGNIVFVVGFGIIMNKGKVGLYAGVLVGSFIKYGFLTFASTKLIYMLKLAIAPKIATQLGVLFSTPQLITALLGGMVALVIIEILIKRKAIVSYS